MAHDLRRPHGCVAFRREAVEIECVGAEAEPRQNGSDITERQSQRYPARVEMQTMQTGHELRPCVLQFERKRSEFPIALVQAGQRVALERMLLDRNEMQPLAARRIAAPRVPGREEVEPQTEAGLDDGERARAGP